MKDLRFYLSCGAVVTLLAWFAVFGREPVPVQTAEEASESVESSEPTLFGISSDHEGDPHIWPEWHHFRNQFAKAHPGCEWKGCKKTGTGMNVHHVIPASWCVKSGNPELVYTDKPPQRFLTLCRDHHELAHSICNQCGGSWEKFNPDAVHDASVGKWNSRGKSEWRFKSDDEVVKWIKKGAQP